MLYVNNFMQLKNKNVKKCENKSLILAKFKTSSITEFRKFFKYLKALPHLFIALTKLFINPKLMCSGGTKILSFLNSG